MDLSAPLLDVAPGVRGALLQALSRLEQPVTRRQLASMAGVAPGHASSVIEELIRSGLVSETLAGRASMIELNEDHLGTDAVRMIASLRGELIRRIREELSTWPGLLGAWLFGSVARGDPNPDSDVDLLIIVGDDEASDLHANLSSLHTNVAAWTGNELQVVEHSPDSWEALVAADNPLVDEIRTDGIALAGNPEALLKRRR